MIFLRFCKSEHALYQHISLLSLLLKVVSVPPETGCFFFHGGIFWVSRRSPLQPSHPFAMSCLFRGGRSPAAMPLPDVPGLSGASRAKGRRSLSKFLIRKSKRSSRTREHKSTHSVDNKEITCIQLMLCVDKRIQKRLILLIIKQIESLHSVNFL